MLDFYSQSTSRVYSSDRQLRLYRHVASLQNIAPIGSCLFWIRGDEPWKGISDPCLRQVESYLKAMDHEGPSVYLGDGLTECSAGRR